MADSVGIIIISKSIGKSIPIPKQLFYIHTINSIYEFGKANKKGERTIKRLETAENTRRDPLEFTKCKVKKIIIGDQAQVTCLNGPQHFVKYGWHTSRVVAVSKNKKLE